MTMKFTAAGDAIIQRRIQDGFEGIEELAPFIQRGDARFFNLETTVHREGECYASQFSGGTYIRTNPEMLDDMKKFGFNMTTFNNNHAMDFSYNGLLRTLEHLDNSGLVHSGVGRNLDEASAPRYLETPNGRVALIAVNTSFNPTTMAGKQGRRMPGRPGVNGVRLEKKHHVTKEELDFIKDLADRMNVNIGNEVDRRDGYLPPLPENEAEFTPLRFVLGEETKVTMHLNTDDMERVKKAIYEAKFQADYTIISIHTHQIQGDNQFDVPDAIREFAHECIDAGANAIIGHGPHFLRAIEVYKDSPIFYSLGDFVIQLYSVEIAPEDFYNKYGLTSDSTVHELLRTRSRDFQAGLMTKRIMFQTVVPYWETKDNKLTKLELLPVESKMSGHKSEIGLPRIATDLSFIDHLAEMSEQYGVRMKVGQDGIVTCEW